MPSLLDVAPLDLTRAVRRLRELRTREQQLTAPAAVLALVGGLLMVTGHSVGVPPAIGAAGALALWGLCRGDRRRLLCDAQHAPLYNPHVPARDLGRILDLLERDIAGRA